jgi:ribosomal protein S18 acetylase RimI-like enzyme
MLPKDILKLRQIIDVSFSRFMGFFAKYSLLEEGQVLVIETERAVVGFTKLIEFNVGEDKFGCVLWIAVELDFRRKGVASSLTNEGIKRLKQNGARAVFASTQRRNAGALRVFTLQGFRKTGFLDLWRLFGWRVFGFFRNIWFAPGEILLMHD